MPQKGIAPNLSLLKNLLFYLFYILSPKNPIFTSGVNLSLIVIYKSSEKGFHFGEI